MLSVILVISIITSTSARTFLLSTVQENAQVNLLFFMIPFGSFWKKIVSLFSSKEKPVIQIENGSLTALARGISTASDSESACQLLVKSAKKILTPQYAHLYLYNPKQGGYLSKNQKKKKGFLPGFIPQEANLPGQLVNTNGFMVFEEVDQEPQIIEKWPVTAEEHNYVLLAPITTQARLAGWLAIGPPKKGYSYTSSDIEKVELLLDLFSPVYERTETIQQYQAQLADWELCKQITDAVRSSETLEQALSELYKHLQDILAIDDLALILRDPESKTYQRVFSIQDDTIKISPANPQALAPDAMEKDAIASGQPRQIEKQGAWIVIPLESSTGICGALRVGSQRNRGVLTGFSRGFIHCLAETLTERVKIHHIKQINLRQKQQLDVFNRVSQQLTSIMHLESLLINILDAAMNILNCSSGILMVIDEDQAELVFEVTSGPVGSALQGERLPSDAGIAGQAFISRNPVISNQLDPSSLWFIKKYPQAASQIENLIAVPLIAHGHVIGILELINKINGLPFNESDQKILENFANQAAVAVHNVSLYSETDQALEARVEELYIMQQIDRDLNATKDIDHALQRMLEAALHHTAVRFGTIGLVDRDDKTFEKIWQIQPDVETPRKLDNLALPGQSWFSPGIFDTEICENRQLSASFNLSESIQYHYIIFTELDDDQALLLILHTDSPSQLTRNNKAFLSRLKDHGIIALKNALLVEELHEAIHAKNEFISFISHELKNPLTVIKGYADILRKGMAGQVNEEQVDYLSTINHNVRRMNTFIKDLSDQAHIETKSLRLDFEPTPILEVFNEVLHSYEAQIKKNSLKIDLHIPADIPDVWCDRLRLIQILANLFSNAVKYSPEGQRVSVGAEQSANIWDEKGTAEVVHFWVEDNGYGISTEDQAHLFEKFYRGSDLRIKKIPGTGLGLRISKSLVEMMGGKMWFNSAIDEGSTFHFTLPI